jgi:o-succinylbenzoate synthase
MYLFQFRIYQRPLLRPLKTHHGLWKIRKGIIIRLEDENGRIGWGEIAPLPEFSSETLSAASAFCQSLGKQVSATTIFSISDHLPACQFAFESAWEDLTLNNNSRKDHQIYSYLLPTGALVLSSLTDILAQSNTNTYKWKIGVDSLQQELELLQKLIALLPADAKLRLDANGGLSINEAKIW